MRKTSVGTLVVVICLAFTFAQSVASAAPVVTQPTGTVLATGSYFAGVNVGEGKITTALGTVTCSTAKLEGTLSSNSTASGAKGSITSGTFSGTGTNGECTSWTGGVSVSEPTSGGLPLCAEATSSADELKLRGGSCSEFSRGMKFTLNFTSIGACLYSRTTAALGTLTTDTSGQDAAVSFSGQEWLAEAGNPFGCPSSGKLSMTFTVTAGGSPLYFSS